MKWIMSSMLQNRIKIKSLRFWVFKQTFVPFSINLPYFFQLNPRGLVFLEGLKSGLYWNEGYIRMRVAVY